MRAMQPTGAGEPVVTRVYAEPRREWYIKVLQPTAHGANGGAGSLLGLVAGLAAGAAGMYLLDPDRGRRRRSLACDKVVHWMHAAADGMRKTARDLGHRAQGMMAETWRGLRPEEPVDDERLVARVRSAMGRVVSHAHAVRVTARDGIVTLSGPVLAHEFDPLLYTVRGVRGVRGVEDQLDVRQTAGDEPALQGDSSRPGARRLDVLQRNWSSPTRTLLGLTGGAMVLGGLAQRGILGALVGGVGVALAARSLTNLPARRLTGVGPGRRAIDVQKAINIDAPLEEVFQFFSAYDNFPLFMSRVREVRDLGAGRSHWVVAGPAGTTVEWDAQITRFEPNRTIAWKTMDGAAVENAGVIRFQPNERGGTRVDVRLSYNPPGGALGHLAAVLFGADPKSDMDEDLMRLKSVIETGRRPRDAAQKPPGVVG